MPHKHPDKFESLEDLQEKIQEVFAREKDRLQNLLPEDTDIQHVGSSSIPGALTKFDVDIQIRVPKAHFQNVQEMLEKQYSSHHTNLWEESLFAIFQTKEGERVDLMLTAIDSDYDNFYKVRDYLTAHPKMLQKYNTLKKSAEGKTIEEYRELKNTFFFELEKESGITLHWKK